MHPQVQGKKWYWPLCINALNLLFVYNWRIYEIANDKKVEQKEFRREIVNILLNLNAEIPKGDSRTGPNPPVPEPVRYDNKAHYPKDIPVRKCVMCGKNARIQCLKCQKILHLSFCFQKFHEQES